MSSKISNGVKMKKIFILAGLLILIISFVIPPAQSKVKSYYSGDAIIYQGSLIVGSVNMGQLELFRLEGKNLIKVAQIRSLANPKLSGSSDFFDLIFSQERNKLYVYSANGWSVYKYNITDLAHPSLVNKLTDNSWDYFLGLGKADDKILTYGTKGIKLWNYDGQVVDSYNLTNKYPYNINFNDNSDYLFNLDNNILKIFDKKSRKFISQTFLIVNEDHNRKSFNDSILSRLYLVDDGSLKMFSLNGSLIKSFKHISNKGYDVAGAVDKNYLYFSDGKGVVKFSKEDLKPIDWAYTTDLGGKNGWAMGLKALNQDGQDRLVIFNNNSILVLDENLELISFSPATEEDKQPQENLFLALDKNRATSNSLISLHGGGYAMNEELIITFANRVYSAKTAGNGRFTTIISVPNVLPTSADIKVVGKYSGLSYSIGFTIE